MHSAVAQFIFPTRGITVNPFAKLLLFVIAVFSFLLSLRFIIVYIVSAKLKYDRMVIELDFSIHLNDANYMSKSVG